MKKGDFAELKMKKTLCLTEEMSDKVHGCQLLNYDDKKECLYFHLESAELPEISLDAIYDCKIFSGDVRINCTGRVRERYCSEAGKVVRFEVENGFYKINIKSVDKQIV